MSPIDALCILQAGWSTEAEHRLFLAAQQVVYRRACVLYRQHEADLAQQRLAEALAEGK